jgi:phage shock protein C
MNNRLYRSPDDRVLAGVAGGMAEAYDFDPALVRLGWALLIVLTGGAFLLIYVIMALVVPVRPYAYTADANAMAGSVPPPGPATTDPSMTGAPAPVVPPAAPWPTYRRHRRDERNGALIFGLILVLIGAYLLIQQFYPMWDLGRFWPLVLVFIGVVLLTTSFGRRAPQ